MYFAVIGTRGFLEDGFWDRLQPPNQPGPGKSLEAVVGQVNFPPLEAIAGGGLVTVVVVVPAFAKAH